jgi:glutaredoxin-dependent peroxiredoxin
MTQTIPAVGTLAPDFTLKSSARADVTLSDYRGRNVLLAFFPLAFTGVCTAELCEMRDDWEQFQGKDTVVLAISVDSTATLAEYKRQHGITAELLSDFKREVSRRYGVLLEDRFHSARAYFLIDRDGVIRWSHVEERTCDRRSDAELLAQIGALA